MSVLMSTDVAFKDATDRYLTLSGQGTVNTFDPMIIPIVKHLNTLDGVATVFSCEGHPEMNKNLPGYLMFALTQRGIEKINIIYRRLTEAMWEQQSQPGVVRVTDLEFKMVTRSSPSARHPYIAHNLHFRLRTVEEKQWFYKKFYEILGIVK